MNRGAFLTGLMLLLLACLLTALAVVQFQEENLTSSGMTVFVSPSSITVTTNQTFEVDIEVSDVVDLYGWEFKLSWNSSLLEVVNVTEKSFLESGGDTYFVSKIINTEGYVLAGCTLLENVTGANGNGTLATVEFKAENEGSCTLDLHDTKLASSLKQLTSHSSIDGNVTSLEGVDYVYVTTKPNNQQGILYMVNVTAFYNSTKIASGISNMSGIVTLTNVPIGNITFVAYAKSDYSQTIANTTADITTEGQSFDLICDQNYGDVSNNWEIIVATLSLSILMIALPILMFSSHTRIKKRHGELRPPNLSKKAGSPSFREGK